MTYSKDQLHEEIEKISTEILSLLNVEPIDWDEISLLVVKRQSAYFRLLSKTPEELQNLLSMLTLDD